MIFWIGFIIMFLNEGFVMMRHVSPWFSRKRDQLIEKFGDGWQYFHGILDYVWVLVVALGLAVSPNKAFHLLLFVTFWNAALTLVYIPMWLRDFWAKKYPEKIFGDLKN